MIALHLALFTFGAAMIVLCVKRGVFEATLAAQMMFISSAVGALSANWSTLKSIEGGSGQTVAFFLLLLSAVQLLVGLGFMHRFRLMNLPARTDIQRSLGLRSDRGKENS